MKKLLAFVLIIITIFLNGCSQESKFGLEQFVDRMNSDFETSFNTSDFLLSSKDDENFLFYKQDELMYTLSLDVNNKIKGIGLLLTAECDIDKGIETFCQMCSTFTGNDFKNQSQIFSDCKITADKINYADSNQVITVGRYKYTVVCNTYSITMFCDKV